MYFLRHLDKVIQPFQLIQEIRKFSNLLLDTLVIFYLHTNSTSGI